MIRLNADYFGKKAKHDLDDVLKEGFKKRWWAQNKYEDMISHEIGHQVLDSIPKSSYYKVKDYFIDHMMEKGIGYWEIEIKKEVSQYAATNWHELFAECFVQRANGKMSPMAKKIMELAGV